MELIIIGATIAASYIIVTLSHLLAKIHRVFYILLPIIAFIISILAFGLAVIIQHTVYAGYLLYASLGLFWATVITLIINVVAMNKSK